MTTYQVSTSRSGAEALAELKSRTEALALGWVAYKAGRNYHELHPDGVDAVLYGLGALRRWWIWLVFVNLWLFSSAFTLWMLYLRFHDVRGESFQGSHDFDVVTRNCLIFLPVAFLALLVTYCRNVDYSLFKRRLVYKVLRPLVKVIDWVPNWALYLTVPCILMFPV